MTNSRPYAMSIAGFDPSGGAGVLADIKTFENNGVYSFGVCSALTIQNDKEFHNVEWIHINTIIEQVQIILKRFNVNYFKIGLIENLFLLQQLILFLKSVNPSAVILWDPILKASAGYNFHANIDKNGMKKIYENITLITPNIPEALQLYPSTDAEKSAEKISKYCNVFLKGGHSDKEVISDILFIDKKKITISSPKILNGEKHGSGCVLSAAILSNLAKGVEMEESCRLAKNYINQFLSSNESLLGYHTNLK